jgi:hypothetical protein
MILLRWRLKRLRILLFPVLVFHQLNRFPCPNLARRLLLPCPSLLDLPKTCSPIFALLFSHHSMIPPKKLSHLDKMVNLGPKLFLNFMFPHTHRPHSSSPRKPTHSHCPLSHFPSSFSLSDPHSNLATSTSISLPPPPRLAAPLTRSNSHSTSTNHPQTTFSSSNVALDALLHGQSSLTRL